MIVIICFCVSSYSWLTTERQFIPGYGFQLLDWIVLHGHQGMIVRNKTLNKVAVLTKNQAQSLHEVLDPKDLSL